MRKRRKRNKDNASNNWHRGTNRSGLWISCISLHQDSSPKMMWSSGIKCQSLTERLSYKVPSVHTSGWEIPVVTRKGCIHPHSEINKVLKFEGSLGKFGFVDFSEYLCTEFKIDYI